MPLKAWIYVIAVLSSAVGLSFVAIHIGAVAPVPWTLFLGLALVTTLLRLVVVEAPRHKVYEGSTIGLFASILLLPVWLFVLVVIIAHSIEWAWVRLRTPQSSHLRAWYIQPFNMAKCIISGSSAYTLLILLPQPTVGPLMLATLIHLGLVICAYVLSNQVLLGMVLFLARGIPLRQTALSHDGLLIEVPLACIGAMVVDLLQRGSALVVFAFAPIVLIYQAFLLPKLQDEAMHALEKVNQDLTTANQAISQLNDELFLTLAKVFDARDPYVGGHAAQVAAYAVAIATELQLPPERIEVVRQSAYLHDIGKLAIPEVILHKPGRLTDAEYDFLKQHTDIGADLIATSQGLRHLAPFVRHHHERWDGQGYPAGIAGDAIPLEARILNVCDSVEAMASDRPYHRGMSMEEIVAEVRRCAGSQFDPTIAAAFIQIAERTGASFVVNSARSVAAQYSGRHDQADGLAAAMLAQVYGTVSMS